MTAGALHEREHELRLIGAALAGARAGRGALLVVEGPAGIGKTALLAAARTLAADEGMRVLRSRGAELEREFAFGVARQLYEPTLAETAAGARSELLGGAAGVAARVLGLPGAGADGAAPQVDPSFAVLHGLYWLCANLAAQGPLCLAVDDVQWADGPSLRYLAFLLPRLEELPVALLLAVRSDSAVDTDALRALTSDPLAETIRPPRLSRAAVGRMVEDGLGEAADPAFVAACAELTGGTPFLVRELVAALREAGVAPTAAATTSIEEIGARAVGRWTLLRLERLPAEAARLARALAILETAGLPEAAALAGLGAEEAAVAADRLAAAEILAPGRPLAFAHPIVRAGVYGELAGADRARGHRQAARLLDEGRRSEQVAEHLLLSDPAADAWVVDRLDAAARAAARSGAPEVAAAYLRRALAEPPPSGRRAGLLLDLGIADTRAGLPDWQADLEAALAAAADGETRAAAALVLGYALARTLRPAEALEVFDRAAASLGADEDFLRLVLEGAAISVGMIDEATAPAVERRARALRERAWSPEPLPRNALAVGAAGAVLGNEPAEAAAWLARRALAAGTRPLQEAADPPWFLDACSALLWAERFDEVAALLDAAIADASASGDGPFFAACVGLRGMLALRRGDLAAAEGDARAALDAEGPPPPLFYRLLNLGVLVETLVERGLLDEAEAVLASAGAEVEGGSQTAAGLRHARGRLRVAQRRTREGVDDLLAAGQRATRTLALSPTYLAWRSEAALALLQTGDREGAARLAGEEVGLARSLGAPRALAVALCAAGVVAGGEHGEELLREAVATHERTAARLEQARAFTELGALLRRGNRRTEARPLLRAALDAAHHAGAGPLAERAETELRATGARPRRVALTGLEALTASERRVASLAADGLTNREIAQALFVTARTVEGHLTSVFRKLQLEDRGQLGSALAASG